MADEVGNPGALGRPRDFLEGETVRMQTGNPIFILSHPRTGSTLLRYLIDSHPKVCSPAEIEIGNLCTALHRTINYTLGETSNTWGPLDRRRAVGRAVRQHVDQIMTVYCEAKGKTRWCDKSITNLDHIDILQPLFPEAQYICLHRSCMDVVHSCLEYCRLGYAGRLADFVSRRPDNIVDALIDSWCDRAQDLIAFERSNPGRCFRLRYEDVVSDPVGVAGRLFAFLNLEFDPGMIDSMFRQSHDRGPGDLKIWFTASIQDDHVGNGNRISLAAISSGRMKSMNSFLKELGYPEVREKSPTNSLAHTAASHAPKAAIHTVDELFTSYFPRQIARQRSEFNRIQRSVALEIVKTGDSAVTWFFDPKGADNRFVVGGGDAFCTLKMSEEDLLNMANGHLNPVDAYLQFRLTLTGEMSFGLGFARLLFNPAEA
jgi:protein-tyrosine sulfotransferase